MIYLACPYTHDDPAVTHERMQLLARETLRLIANDVALVTPLVLLAHSIQLMWPKEKLPTYEQWMSMDLAFIKRADEVWVMCLPGWRDSKGVGRELECARLNGKPIKYLIPTTDNCLLILKDEPCEL